MQILFRERNALRCGLRLRLAACCGGQHRGQLCCNCCWHFLNASRFQRLGCLHGVQPCCPCYLLAGLGGHGGPCWSLLGRCWSLRLVLRSVARRQGCIWQGFDCWYSQGLIHACIGRGIGVYWGCLGCLRCSCLRLCSAALNRFLNVGLAAVVGWQQCGQLLQLAIRHLG